MEKLINPSSPLSLRKCALFLTASFCGYYLAGITSISPVYFIFGIAFILSLFTNLQLLFPKIVWPAIIYFIYLLLTQPFLDPSFSSFFGACFSISVFLFMMMQLSNVRDKGELIFFGENFIRFSSLLLWFECIWRIAHPQRIIDINHRDVTDKLLWFYQYKFGSIIFQDSNFVGLFVIVVLFFTYYLSKKTHKRYTFYKISLIILLILTFSRSAWIAAILSTLLLKYFNRITFKSVIGVILFTATVVGMTTYFAHDESYLSKFQILRSVWNLLSQSSWLELLLGIGFGNTVLKLEIGAHNIILTFLLEAGLIGLVLYSLIILTFLRSTKGQGKMVIFPYLIAGLSAFNHANPYFFVPISLIYFIERNES